MQSKLKTSIVLIGLGLLIFNPIFVYAQQTTSKPVTSPKEALPQYNAGVDQSIKDYLCTPSEPADGHDLERCINRLYRFSVTAGALVVLALIVIAGGPGGIE